MLSAEDNTLKKMGGGSNHFDLDFNRQRSNLQAGGSSAEEEKT